MSKRARGLASQGAHDRVVEDLARRYNKPPNIVWADGITGWSRPKTYFGKRPDLVIRHPEGTLLIEVETVDSLHTLRAKKQHRAFSNWAARSPSRRYERIIV